MRIRRRSYRDRSVLDGGGGALLASAVVATLSELASSGELMTNLTLRELRGKYKRSVLGWTWSLLNPLATMLVYTAVFTVLGANPTKGDPSGLKSFPFYLMCGLIP